MSSHCSKNVKNSFYSVLNVLISFYPTKVLLCNIYSIIFHNYLDKQNLSLVIVNDSTFNMSQQKLV